MLRFRNPGSSLDSWINIFKVVYEMYKGKEFHYYDIGEAMAITNLMTSKGYTGKEAIARSKTEDTSFDSVKMNGKMYAEVFRLFGWITPKYENQSYPVKITFLGDHIGYALNNNFSTEEIKNLLLESFLGIVYPNELYTGVSEDNIRFGISSLRAIKDLNDFIYKHELISFPMDGNDQDSSTWNNRAKKILEDRVNLSNNEYKNQFEQFSSLQGMKPTSVDNLTRTPISLLKSLNLVEDSIEKIYGTNKRVIKITNYGNSVFNKYKDYYDIRLEDFNNISDENLKNSIIRYSLLTTLNNSGFDIIDFFDVYEEDKKMILSHFNTTKVLFSPCHTLRDDKVREALKILNFDKHLIDDQNIKDIVEFKDYTNLDSNKIKNQSLILIKGSRTISLSKEDILIIDMINKVYKSKNNNIDSTITYFMNKYRNANKNVFYPLVNSMLKISGFNCVLSKEGDNSRRWDAAIVDSRHSIPIEIKSPGEEEFISVKAIRQALENKIVLLSRKTITTDQDTTTIAIGYKLPNERAEVNSLIEMFKESYNINISVLSFDKLLLITLNSIINNEFVNFDDLKNAGGIIDEITSSQGK